MGRTQGFTSLFQVVERCSSPFSERKVSFPLLRPLVRSEVSNVLPVFAKLRRIFFFLRRGRG